MTNIPRKVIPHKSLVLSSAPFIHFLKPITHYQYLDNDTPRKWAQVPCFTKRRWRLKGTLSKLLTL